MAIELKFGTYDFGATGVNITHYGERDAEIPESVAQAVGLAGLRNAGRPIGGKQIEVRGFLMGANEAALKTLVKDFEAAMRQSTYIRTPQNLWKYPNPNGICFADSVVLPNSLELTYLKTTERKVLYEVDFFTPHPYMFTGDSVADTLTEYTDNWNNINPGVTGDRTILAATVGGDAEIIRCRLEYTLDEAVVSANSVVILELSNSIGGTEKCRMNLVSGDNVNWVATDKFALDFYYTDSNKFRMYFDSGADWQIFNPAYPANTNAGDFFLEGGVDNVLSAISGYDGALATKWKRPWKGQ